MTTAKTPRTTAKTAISLPQKLFMRADRAAKKMKVSRSELYRKAIKEFLDREERGRWITEQMNRVCDQMDTSLDPVMKEVTRRGLLKQEW